MSRAGGWSRLLGVGIAVVAFGALLVWGLLPGTSEVGTAPDPHNGRGIIQDNLWSTDAHQYAVWVGLDGTPYAGRRELGEGEWEIANLARIPGNPLSAPTEEDRHNIYSMGVDADGSVHVAGNMHNDPLRYVRSTANRLSGWTTNPAPIKGSSATYPAFAGMPDGTLMFWRRRGVAGDGITVLDVLGPSMPAWKQRGVILDGRPSGESAYLHRVAVDPASGAVHLMFEWRGGLSADTNSDVGYARSSDAGRTWETSGGEPLRLPITHESAELVIDTPPNGSGLLNGGGLTVDSDGRPHGVVSFNRPGTGRAFEHVWLDQGEWRREPVDGDFYGRPQVAGTPDGRVWVLGVEGTTIKAVDVSPDRERLDTREIAQAPLDWEVTYDPHALAREGVLQMLVPDGDRPRVVEADLLGA